MSVVATSCSARTYSKSQTAGSSTSHVREAVMPIPVECKTRALHTVIQVAQITLPQHNNLRSCSDAFSDRSVYCGGIVDSSNAQVQHASSAMFEKSQQVLYQRCQILEGKVDCTVGEILPGIATLLSYVI